jgi:hypothetical protein
MSITMGICMNIESSIYIMSLSERLGDTLIHNSALQLKLICMCCVQKSGGA